jgi:hypothetical protein
MGYDVSLRFEELIHNVTRLGSVTGLTGFMVVFLRFRTSSSKLRTRTSVSLSLRS